MIAVKLAYLGSRFRGFAKQLGKRTVQGELEKALKKCGGSGLKIGSRTDRGVIALGNVVSFGKDNFVLGELNSFLPRDICAWAWADAPEQFNPRHAVSRHYRQACKKFRNLKRVKQAAKLLKGVHSFHNFCKNEGRDTLRKVLEIKASNRKDYAIVDVKGESFLWQMVRRIVYALEEVDSGKMSLSELEDLLRPEIVSFVPPASPEGLMLIDVDYGIKFNEEQKWKGKAAEMINNELLKYFVLKEASEWMK